MGEKVRVDNFAALVIAVKQVLPFAVLFYVIDFLWYGNTPEGLMSSMMASTLFIVGFLIIDFFIARSRLKGAGRQMQPQVIVVQQPVYIPQPGYGYPPYGAPQGAPPPQIGPDGQPYYPQPYYGQPPQQGAPQQPVTAAWPAPPPQAPPPLPPPPPPPAADDDAWLPPKPAPQDPRKRPPGGTG